MVNKDGSLSVGRQCALLALPRSTFYHSPEPVSGDGLAIMSLIDHCHLKYPFYGSRRIRGWLLDEGHCVNRKRVQRLMRTIGLAAYILGATSVRRIRRTRCIPICCGT
jgi:putative transposase